MYASGVFYINRLFSVRFKIFIHVVYMTFKRKFFQKVDYPGARSKSGLGVEGCPVLKHLWCLHCSTEVDIFQFLYLDAYIEIVKFLSMVFCFHIQILMIFFFGKVHIVSDFEIIEFDYPRYGSLMDCYYKIYACLNNRTGNQLWAIANISLHCMYIVMLIKWINLKTKQHILRELYFNCPYGKTESFTF